MVSDLTPRPEPRSDPMTPEELYNARRTLGFAWGLERPLHLSEMAQVLRLSGSDPAASMRDYERGKTRISGPLSVAVDMMLAGAPPPDGVPGDGS